jgi:hypothetical protein
VLLAVLALVPAWDDLRSRGSRPPPRADAPR